MKRRRGFGRRIRGRRMKRRRVVFGRRRRLRPSFRQVHHFRRGGGSSTTTFSGVSPFLNVTYVQLSQLLNYGEFQTLYDQYKINYVVDKYWLKIDPGAQAAGSATWPKMYICRDLDDTTTPASLNELRERNNCRIKVMNPNRPVVVKWVPNVLNSIYSNGVSDASATPLYKQWIDVGAPNVTHYGYKYAIDDYSNTNYKFDFERIVYLSCKNQR